MEEIRVRFAPSPTGYLHIGGARTALFNWFFARKNQGKLVLRIEDTDTDRLKADSVAQILTSLKWLGIDWEEGPEIGGESGPYFQSQRLSLYRQEAERLVSEGKAYYCFCTPAELDAAREAQKSAGEAFRYRRTCRDLAPEAALLRREQGEAAVIRLKIPEAGQVVVQDLIRGSVKFGLDQLDDMIILKSNGMPAYNFACVIDDHAMKMSHVIRAEEHLSNTPKQVLLYEALHYEVPQFAHLPMILAPDRSKLSKRHGATSVEEFREQGFLAPAIVNYLTLLGWSGGGEQEIMTPQQATELFSLEKVAKTAAIYDTKKLAWMNGQYLNQLPLAEVTREALPFLIRKGFVTEAAAAVEFDSIAAIVVVVRERVKTLVELADAMTYFFLPVTEYDPKGQKKYFEKENTLFLLQQARACLAADIPFDVAHTEAAYLSLIEKLAIKGGELIHPTRLALTGRTVSPGLFDVMALLGKECCLARLDQAIAYIEQGENEA